MMSASGSRRRVFDEASGKRSTRVRRIASLMQKITSARLARSAVTSVEAWACGAMPSRRSATADCSASGRPGVVLSPALRATTGPSASLSISSPSRGAISVLQIAWAIGDRLVLPSHTNRNTRWTGESRRARCLPRVSTMSRTNAALTIATPPNSRTPGNRPPKTIARMYEDATPESRVEHRLSGMQNVFSLGSR